MFAIEIDILVEGFFEFCMSLQLVFFGALVFYIMFSVCLELLCCYHYYLYVVVCVVCFYACLCEIDIIVA